MGSAQGILGTPTLKSWWKGAKEAHWENFGFARGDSGDPHLEGNGSYMGLVLGSPRECEGVK